MADWMHRLSELLERADWGDAPTWPAAAVTVIFGLVSWRSSRKSKADREQAERAVAAAERAVAAA